MMSEVRLSGGGSVGELAPEVAGLVDYLWEETSGKLRDVLAVPVASMKTEQVSGEATITQGDSLKIT